MKTRLLTVLAFAVVAALLTSGVWAGEENVWEMPMLQEC